MNAKRSHLLIALYALFALLLLWGGLKLIFGIGFGPLVDQIVPNGVMIGAVGIFGWNRWLVAQEQKAIDQKKDEESPKE